MITVAGLLPVYAGTTALKFTANDVKNAKRMATKPPLVLSWETRVKLANDALARDAATVKSGVDGVLERANQKYASCSAKDYTIQDLQALCKPNEGAQQCLDRLVMDCMVGQAAQQQGNALANALAAPVIKTALDNLKKDITTLENALFK